MGMQKTVPVGVNPFADSRRNGTSTPGFGRLRNKIETMRMLALELASEMDGLGSTRTIDLDAGIDLQEEVKAFEVALIKRALVKSGYCQAKAARMLRINASTLAYKIKTYEIALPAETNDLI